MERYIARIAEPGGSPVESLETDLPPLQQVLETFLTTLRQPGDGVMPLNWLADEIEKAIHSAEEEVQFEQDDHVSSDRERLELALRVAYHHLVAFPSILMYLQEYWRSRTDGNLVLASDDTKLLVAIDQEKARPLTVEAYKVITDLIYHIDRAYKLGIGHPDWLRWEHGERHG
jgi:hypothetical protein